MYKIAGNVFMGDAALGAFPSLSPPSPPVFAPPQPPALTPQVAQAVIGVQTNNPIVERERKIAAEKAVKAERARVEAEAADARRRQAEFDAAYQAGVAAGGQQPNLSTQASTAVEPDYTKWVAGAALVAGALWFAKKK